jgi:DNA replication protein DnaC
MRPDDTPSAFGAFPRMKLLRLRLEERHRWEAENPELAKAWEDAWTEDEHREREIEAEAARVQFRENMPFRLERIGVPSLVIDALSNSVIETVSVQHVRSFCASDRQILLLLGGPGTGKTVAAASALIEAPMHSSVFTHAADVARLSDFNVEHAHEMDRINEAKFLVLDDLGVEHANDFWVSRFDGILNQRYGNKRKTIITSNLDAERFKRQYGVRVSERIHQVGVVKSCGNKSMRRAAP